MKNEMKFKAFVNNEIIDVNAIDFIEREITLADGDIYKFEDVELLQYSGMNDRNGHGIFTGMELKYFETSSRNFFNPLNSVCQKGVVSCKWVINDWDLESIAINKMCEIVS